MKMTPCEKLGYRVGDRFVSGPLTGVGELTCPLGTELTLVEDDGSGLLKFRDGAGVERHEYLGNVTPLKIAKAAEWNGEGLPPVGTVCEAKTVQCARWNMATIVHVTKKGVALYEDCFGDYMGSAAPSDFRPLKSDRKREIDQISYDGGISFCAAGKLYDAGYRKKDGKS